MRWVALLAVAIALLVAAVSCAVDVPLGVDPRSDGASDAGNVD
jgi:hypothetical protein